MTLTNICHGARRLWMVLCNLTPAKAAYPKLLCERFATILADEAKTLGFSINPFFGDEPMIDPRVATNKQPRGRKIPPIVSEYFCTRTVRAPVGEQPELDDKNILRAPFHDIPTGAKLLRNAKAKRGFSDDSTSSCLWVFGLFRSMQQFFRVATEMSHPFDTFRAVPLSESPLETMKMRMEVLGQWRKLAIELRNDNDSIFAAMDKGSRWMKSNRSVGLMDLTIILKLKNCWAILGSQCAGLQCGNASGGLLMKSYTECGVNSSFSYMERVDLKALDEIVWTACCLVRLCIYESRFDFHLSDGARLAGKIHETWKALSADQVQLVSKTVDLRSAYKQFAIHPSDRKFSAIALKRPGGAEASGFISRTLPFGSVASVLHFNGVARLVQRIGLEARMMLLR